MHDHPLTLNTGQACLYADKALGNIIRIYGKDEPIVEACQYIIDLCEAAHSDTLPIDAFGLAICATYAGTSESPAPTPDLLVEELRLLAHRVLFNLKPDYPYEPESRAACLRILSICGNAQEDAVSLPADVFTDAMLGLTWTRDDATPSEALTD